MKGLEKWYFWGDPNDTAFYDVHELFQFYDQYFFDNKLGNCVVRWTKRMTSCAGTCTEKFGSSTISLSEPLLKFRNSNELKETLLHEMIHAFLFKTNRKACEDDGHGPAFQEIMMRINQITGLNITVFHSFHDEVNFYKNHVWRCNGRCRENPPYYGYVRRAMNRAPQPADYWFAKHFRECGGTYIKISGPEKNSKEKNSKQKQSKEKKETKKQRKSKKIEDQSDLRKWGFGKSIADYAAQMQMDKSKNEDNLNGNNSLGKNMPHRPQSPKSQIQNNNQQKAENPTRKSQQLTNLLQKYNIN